MEPDTTELDEASEKHRYYQRLTRIWTEDIHPAIEHQIEKFGVLQHNSPLEWVSIELEELGEVSSEVNKAHYGTKSIRRGWRNPELLLRRQKQAKVIYRLELARFEWCQVVAVGMAAIEELERTLQAERALLDEWSPEAA